MISQVLFVILFFLNPLAVLGSFDNLSSNIGGFLSWPSSASAFIADSKNESRQVERGVLPLSANFKSSAINSFSPDFLPIRDWEVPNKEIEAKAALVALVTCEKSGVSKKEPLKPIQSRILFQKNSYQTLPIASLTKLMTAMVVLDNVSTEKKVVVSEKAISTHGEMGNLQLNEEIKVKDLLEALLIESSNDAAVALAEKVEESTGSDFIVLMNNKANELGLKKTKFVGPAGLDKDNMSSAKDLHLLMRYAFNYSLIWDILKTPIKLKYNQNGYPSHRWINTNKLLSQIPEIIGGKTGYTHEAKECFVVALKKQPQKYLIFIILGSDARFYETKELINWIDEAYKWQS